MYNLEQAAQQALEALEMVVADVKTTPNAYEAQRQAIETLRQALEQPADEPVNLPPPEFEWAADGIEIGHDMFGGVDIRLDGEFVYVHINYDYRYTDNATLQRLAEQIVGILTGSQPPREWVGLTDAEIRETIQPFYQKESLDFAIKVSMDEYRAIEEKVREKNA